MNAFAPLLAALAVTQAAPPEAAQPGAAAERSAPAKEPAAASVGAAAPSPAVGSTTAPSPRPAPPARAGGEGGPKRTATPTATATATPTPTATATPTPTATPTSTATATPTAIQIPARGPVDAPKVAPRPLPEREDAERAARAFLEALVARDADALAAASAERFSFDGDAQGGREAVRRTWRTILAGREGEPPRIRALEILAAADAIARFGRPPARIAPLARPGVLVAVADVGGRTVVLFLARDGGRMAVLGMHD
jgi:hypothetical protein